MSVFVVAVSMQRRPSTGCSDGTVAGAARARDWEVAEVCPSVGGYSRAGQVRHNEGLETGAAAVRRPHPPTGN